MMYLSQLLIDLGSNPDRPRPARRWLRNRYHVHQRLCMAFPSDAVKANDPHFLGSFNPAEFGKGQVHVERKVGVGFLYRLDPLPGGKALILVQSALKPDWDYAFHNAPFQPYREVCPFSPAVPPGEVLRFRLDANPTKRLRETSRHANGEVIYERWVGKRVPVPADKLEEWLARHAEREGFQLRKVLNLTTGYVYFNSARERGRGQQLRAVRYEGVLEVTDTERFNNCRIRGIGPAKAFGFGLLSLAKTV